MPVYKFYCPDCHTIFNFFSRRVDTETRPACPGCSQPDLEQQASPFAISKARGEHTEDAELPPGMDEEQLMHAFASMAGDLDNLDENDPKQAARIMRRLFDATGMQPGAGTAEAMRRMEAGEDPDRIEAELGDVLEQEDPFFTGTAARSPLPDLKTLRRELMPPRQDETWYPLR